MLNRLVEDVKHLALTLPLNDADQKVLEDAARVLIAIQEYRRARIDYDEATEAQPQPANYHGLAVRFERAEKSLLELIEC